MNKYSKNINDSNYSNATAYTEDLEESNRDKSLENTNDFLFSPMNEFILNKKIIKFTKNPDYKKPSNKTFCFNRQYNEDWDNINIEKWFKNKIKIEKNEINSKKRIYKLYLDERSKSRSSVLSAQKEKGIYVIRNNEGIVAKIRWNIFSSHFKVYDDMDNLIEEIIYNFNFKGWNGPTKLKILLPKTEKNSKRPWNKNKNKKIVQKIENKMPEYSDLFHVYVLKFINRKVIPNERNIQLINTEYKEDNNNILLQFAQSDQNEFILDYKYPFNNITAFALGITSLSSRTFCK